MTAPLKPVVEIAVEGRGYRVWGKAPAKLTASWHDACWTVIPSRTPEDPAALFRPNGYPTASIVPIQPLNGWVGVRVGLGQEPPFNEGWYVHQGDSEYVTLGWSRTAAEAWQVAASALHQQIATELRGSS